MFSVYTCDNGQMGINQENRKNMIQPTLVQLPNFYSSLKVINSFGYYTVIQAYCKSSHKTCLLIAGSAHYGQAGTISNSKLLAFKEADVIDGKLRFISSGSTFLFIQMENGSVWSRGCNTGGELGLGYQSPHEFDFKHVKLPFSDPFSILSMISGGSHTYIIGTGELYGCGLNSNGQLGLGKSSQAQYTTFTKISTITEQVVDVAAGFYFTIVMTEHEGQRKLYGFGQNDVSQIAGKNTDEKEPALIEGINANHVVSFACSGFHSFFVTFNGKIYVVGRNCNEDRISTRVPKNIVKPMEMEYVPKDAEVRRVTCMSRNSLFYDRHTEKIWARGCNQFGELTRAPYSISKILRLNLPFDGKKLLQVGHSHSTLVYIFGPEPTLFNAVDETQHQKQTDFHDTSFVFYY